MHRASPTEPEFGTTAVADGGNGGVAEEHVEHRHASKSDDAGKNWCTCPPITITVLCENADGARLR